MTDPVDTTAIDAGFEDICDVENVLAGRFGTVRPFQNPITPAEIAAENYAAESLVLSAPREVEEE